VDWINLSESRKERGSYPHCYDFLVWRKCCTFLDWLSDSWQVIKDIFAVLTVWKRPCGDEYDARFRSTNFLPAAFKVQCSIVCTRGCQDSSSPSCPSLCILHSCLRIELFCVLNLAAPFCFSIYLSNLINLVQRCKI
jgi:hypothetical protein